MPSPTTQPAMPSNPPARGRGLGMAICCLLGVVGLSIPTLFVLGIIAFALTIFTGFMGYFFALIVLFGFLMIATAVRRIRAEINSRLLSYLDLATRLNLPLPEFLQALERSEGWTLGRRARQIGRDLRVGIGLGDALYTHVPEVPSYQSAIIWRGERIGRLRDAVARAAANAQHNERNTQDNRNDVALQYTLVMLIVLLGITSLVGIFIMPSFYEIFVDFDAPLPAMTEATFYWAQRLSPLLLVIVGFVLLLVTGWSTYNLFHTSEIILGPIRRLLGPILWHVPVLSNAFRDRALADACFGIEQAMRSGRPLPEAIDTACAPVESGVLERRFRRFAEHLRQGQPLQDAARRARMPALIVGMLGSASTSATPADVFAFLARYYGERVSPLEAIVRATALPLATLAAAVCVAWVVLAMLYPLVILIEHTLESTGMA